jgi:toxin ParE1/3/4
VRKLLLRPAAEADLDDIYRYIAEQSGSPERAIRYVRRVREWCDHLLIFPEAGRARDDLRPGARLTTFERRVVIAYMILPPDDVEIGRVFYGGRNYEVLIPTNLADEVLPLLLVGRDRRPISNVMEYSGRYYAGLSIFHRTRSAKTCRAGIHRLKASRADPAQRRRRFCGLPGTWRQRSDAPPPPQNRP